MPNRRFNKQVAQMKSRVAKKAVVWVAELGEDDVLKDRYEYEVKKKTYQLMDRGAMKKAAKLVRRNKGTKLEKMNLLL